MLGDRLVEKRKQKKMTQEEVAKRLGIPRSTYSNYELGNREPDVETLNMLSSLFDCKVDWLTGNDSIAESHKDDTPLERKKKEIIDFIERSNDPAEIELTLEVVKKMLGK